MHGVVFEMLVGAIVRGHFLVMMSRDRVARRFGAPLEHLGLLLEQSGLCHDALPSGQAGHIKDGRADHGADGPEGGIPVFRMGAVVFEG